MTISVGTIDARETVAWHIIKGLTGVDADKSLRDALPLSTNVSPPNPSSPTVDDVTAVGRA